MNRNYNRKTLYIIFTALIVSILTLTTAYAALNVSLNVTGSAQVQSAKWDIHFENIRIKYGSVGATKNPTIETPTSVDFSVILNKPGDFFEFSVDILNKGTINAMINGINKTPTLSSIQQKYLKYEITYDDGNTINSKHLLKPNKLKNIRVLVEYKKDISVSDIPVKPEEIKLGFTLNYSQSDTSAITPSNGSGDSIPKLVRMTQGNINSPQVGDLFAIKDEEFYIYSSTETTVTGFAKYNLYVGGRYEEDDTWTSYGNKATGIQNQNMLGLIFNISYKNGTTIFSDENNHGIQYSSFENSVVYKYVMNYKDILESYGIKINEARLITIEELQSLGCVINGDAKGNCGGINGTPEWIHTTTYWTQSSLNDKAIWIVLSNSNLAANYYDSTIRNGVRPVITIDKSYFNKS